MAERVAVALVEATSLWGKELRRMLEQSPLGLAEPVFLGASEDQGTLTEFAGSAHVQQVLDAASIEGIDVLFFCGRSGLLASSRQLLAGSSALAVDVIGSLPLDAGGELVLAGAREGSSGCRLLLNPRPTSIVAASVLGALEAFGPEAAQIVGLLPACLADQAGIEELHAQCVGLLNASGMPSRVFGRQLAFNLLPEEVFEPGAAARTEAELAQLLGPDGPRVGVSLLRVPSFIGLGVLLHLGLSKPAEREALEAALAAVPALELVTADDPAGPADLPEAGLDRVRVSVLESGEAGVRLWCVADPLRRAGPLNALEVVESRLGVSAGS